MKLPIAPQRRYAPEPLFLIAVLFAVAAPVFWLHSEVRPSSLGVAYENADLYQWIYPEFHYLAGRFHSFDLPLWNPRQLGGTPVLADLRNGLFQPLNLVLLAGPTERALALHAFLCLFLMGAFFAVYLRGLGLKYLPALLGAIAYAFSGTAAAAMSRPAMADSLVWAPLVFWAMNEFTSTHRRAYAVLAGVFLSLLFFAGSPAIFVAVGVLLIAWGLFNSLKDGAKGRDWRPMAGLFAAGAAAFGVTAIQWAPTLAWAWRASYNTGVLWNLDLAGRLPDGLLGLPAFLLTVQDPTVPNAVYMGVATLLAIPAAFFHRRLSRAAWFWLGAGAFALVIAVGSSRAWWLAFPPQAFAFAALLALATLAAIGFDRILETPAATEPTSHRWPVFGLVLAVALLVFYVAPAQTRGNAAAFCAVILLLSLFRAGWYAVVVGGLFAVFLFADLFVSSTNVYRHPYEDAPACYQQHAALFTTAEERSLGRRVVVSAGPLNVTLPQNLGMITPLNVVGGVNFPMTDPEAAWWRRILPTPSAPLGANEHAWPRTPSLRLLNLAAGRCLILGPKGPLALDPKTENATLYRTIQEEDGARLVESEAALPRAYWVPLWRDGLDAMAAVNETTRADFDPARECMVVGEKSALDGLADLGVSTGPVPSSNAAMSWRDATCTISDDDPEHMIVEVNVPVAGVAVLADTYDPAWQARVDGTPVPVLQVNGIFRGVGVPAGKHRIDYVYRPVAFAAGLGISLATLGFLGLVALTQLLRRRRSQ